ncbi:undecaprenyl-phosphate glucose phosphotransferase [Chitinophagaceae bacterium LB-8]|uniref:Undecaprenyl-phosphate glucose phosphotransferase n=1 Tax=Paraflavisolibacter caeni TaxID=2982496 RepID=A0A9X2XTR1_9BACT|nr:undecaprenyl-phosphate glucose phosphotransferase [Paraflavisolibacter caeni]MCU7548277.1 undecaprenyl-phosphate glucose phosphotransferase [Paraflavisolibacter caeni]
MKKHFINFLQAGLVGFDIITLNCWAFIAYWICDSSIPDAFLAYYSRFVIVLNLLWIAVSWIGKLYREDFIVTFESFSRKTFRIYFTWISAAILYLFFFRQFDLSRSFILISVIGYGFVLFINRLAYLSLFRLLHNHIHSTRNVLILGYNKVSKKIVEYVENSGFDVRIIGFCEESKNVTELTTYPVISGVEGATKASVDFQVNEIYSTISPEQDPRIYQIMQHADQECIRFKIVPDLSVFINCPVSVSYLNDLPVLSLHKEPLDNLGNMVKKRLFDIVFSLFVIIFILSWLIPILSLLIFLESPGPVFFLQYRTGKDKKIFKCFKFRSMKVNGDSNLRQATKDDDRLTKIGKFIRRTSLDEYPQFFNVLLGNMSIVGPRPHMLKHTNDYSKLISRYMVRQFLKPGITGWAQVNGFRGETKTLDQMQQRVEHDIWYMENWSLWLDVRIIFLTVFNAVKGEKNAY